MEINSYILNLKKDDINFAILNMVISIAIARFEYGNIEDTDIKEDSIEKAFFYSPYCGITLDDDNKLCALPFIPTKFDFNGRPKVGVMYAYYPDSNTFEMFKSNLEVGKDCVVIQNNPLRVDVVALITPYLTRLSKIWKEAGNNLTLAKTIGIVFGDNISVKQKKEIISDLYNEGIAFMGDTNKKEYELTKPEPFSLGVEYMPDKFQKDFDETFLKMLTVLGINTPTVEKRERLLVDEVNANNSLTNIIERSYTMYREEGIREVNKLFGTNIEFKKVQQLSIYSEVKNEPKTLGETDEVTE